MKRRWRAVVYLVMRLLPLALLPFFLPVLLAAASDSDAPPEPGQLALPGGMSNIATTVSAQPLSVSQKFDFRIIQSFGYRSMVGSAMSAAIGQLRDVPHEWGQGAAGLGRRFGWAVAQNLTRQSIAFGLETALHEDPRYFPSASTSKKQRFLNAIRQTYLTKTDSGKSQFAWGRIVSDLAAGQIANAWQPPSTRGFGNGLGRGFISVGGDALFNAAQEFFPFLRDKSFSKP